MNVNTSNLNSLWASLTIEELKRCGVTSFCVASGSRSSPLVTAVAESADALTTLHFDERAAGYFAVGHARATGKPAAVIVTSGTAVANLLPAVVEASNACLPMIIISADRPPELRATGSNQTIDQPKLFGDFARFFFDLPCPSVDIDPAMVLTTVDEAVASSLGALSGPVHLNCMYREPLAPISDGQDYSSYIESLSSWLNGERPYTKILVGKGELAGQGQEGLIKLMTGAKRGLLVAGTLAPQESKAVLHLAEALGWPIFPDVTSSMRFINGNAQVVHFYDQVLLSEAFRSSHQPDVVLRVGGPLVSKRLQQFVDAAEGEVVAIQSDPRRRDPSHRVDWRVIGDIAELCKGLSVSLAQSSKHAGWLQAWREASSSIGKIVETVIGQHDEITEPFIARTVTSVKPEGRPLIVGNSMPIRDVDMFGAPKGHVGLTLANRGASGIDGTIATAVGVANALKQGTTLLLGDLSFLHDIGSLAMIRSAGVELVIVVINNNGGGIYSFLPISEHKKNFEKYFGTPHDLRFEKAAALYGLNYASPESTGAFEKAYRGAIEKGGSTLIEVVTERAENRAIHQEIADQVITALAQA